MDRPNLFTEDTDFNICKSWLCDSTDGQTYSISDHFGKKMKRPENMSETDWIDKITDFFNWQVWEDAVGYKHDYRVDDPAVDEEANRMVKDLNALIDRINADPDYLNWNGCGFSWKGHEMTRNQKELCETVWVSVSDYWKELPPDCDISENMEKSYERETGKSCVNWRDSETWGCKTTLPRSEDYTTEGFTDEFEQWATDIIAKAVVEEGCKTQLEVADFIRKRCPTAQD